MLLIYSSVCWTSQQRTAHLCHSSVLKLALNPPGGATKPTLGEMWQSNKFISNIEKCVIIHNHKLIFTINTLQRISEEYVQVLQ